MFRFNLSKGPNWLFHKNWIANRIPAHTMPFVSSDDIVFWEVDTIREEHELLRFVTTQISDKQCPKNTNPLSLRIPSHSKP